MQTTLNSFHVSSTSTSSGRLDDLCVNTTDLLPPSKPVRQITSEYNRGGRAAESSTTTALQHKDNSWTRRRRSPSTESTETLPGITPTQTSGCPRPQLNGILFSSSSNNNNWDSPFLKSAQIRSSESPSFNACCNRGLIPTTIMFPVISNPVIHASNMFFGTKSATKKSLLEDEDDNDEDLCVLWAHPLQFNANDIDDDISDLEADDPVITTTVDASRWSNSSRSILDRIFSSSEFSVPLKPQRKASFLSKTVRKV